MDRWNVLSVMIVAVYTIPPPSQKTKVFTQNTIQNSVFMVTHTKVLPDAVNSIFISSSAIKIILNYVRK
jgi:hypothetical protein